MSDSNHPHPNYLAVFGALCVLTAVSWFLDEANGWGLFSSRALLITLVCAVAMAKALFVMAYFMHLKFEGRWKYVLLAPTVTLAIGLPIALMPDLSLDYYERDPLTGGVAGAEWTPAGEASTDNAGSR